VPAHSHTPDARQPQASPVEFEAVAVLLEAERVETIAPLEARIACSFTRLHAAKESVEGFVQVLHDTLQNMTVDVGGVRVGVFQVFDLAKLRVWADAFFALFPRCLALFQAGVVPPAARLKRLFKQTFLSAGWIQPIFEGLEHTAIIVQMVYSMQVCG